MRECHIIFGKLKFIKKMVKVRQVFKSYNFFVMLSIYIFDTINRKMR